MKIIHIISTLSKGGAEKVAVDLANEAIKNGHEILLIVGWQNNPEYLQNQVSKNVSIEFVSRENSFANIKLLSWLLVNRKRIASYDILHCHLTYGAIAGTMVYLVHNKLFGYKRPMVVETYHAVGMTIPSHKRWFHSILLNFRDGIVMMANDNYWNKFIASHPRIKTRLIKNGTSVTGISKSASGRQEFVSQNFKSVNPRFIVGTVGVLRPDRQPWLYIPIFKALHEALGDDVGFVMAGDGSEREKINTLITQAGITNQVYMPGLVNNPASIIACLDVYVSLGVREIAGISMIEAAMGGVPVVAIQLDKLYQSAPGDWFWSSPDTSEVAEKILALLKNESERQEVASIQRNYVNTHFTSSAMFQSYLQFYEETIARL